MEHGSSGNRFSNVTDVETSKKSKTDSAEIKKPSIQMHYKGDDKN